MTQPTEADVERVATLEEHRAQSFELGYEAAIAGSEKALAVAREALDTLVRTYDNGIGAMLPDNDPINMAWKALATIDEIVGE